MQIFFLVFIHPRRVNGAVEPALGFSCSCDGGGGGGSVDLAGLAEPWMLLGGARFCSVWKPQLTSEKLLISLSRH